MSNKGQPWPNIPDFEYRHEPWMDEAECQSEDPDLFYPRRGASPREVEVAKNICRSCDVRETCLAYALRTESASHGLRRAGIWGATMPEERAAMADSGKEVA